MESVVVLGVEWQADEADARLEGREEGLGCCVELRVADEGGHEGGVLGWGQGVGEGCGGHGCPSCGRVEFGWIFLQRWLCEVDLVVSP